MTRTKSTLRRCALAFALGAFTTLAVCLLFSFRSAAAHRTAWVNVVAHRFAYAVVGEERSLGKSVITWAPLRDAELPPFERSGTHGPAQIPLGERTPPAWSSMWSTREFDAARAATGPHAHVRTDIAVGWPFRAFACTRDAQGAVSGGVPLGVMGADQGRGYVLAELRAIPLRPIWRGVLTNILFYTLAAYAGLICLEVRARHRAPRARAPRSLPRSLATCLCLGLLTTACTAVLLPMLLRERSVTSTSTVRAGAYTSRDLFWTRRTARLTADEANSLNPRSARLLDTQLASLGYSSNPSEHAKAPQPPQDFIGPPAPEPPTVEFTAITTGWPLPCLWGASWRVAEEPPTPAALIPVPRLRGVAGVLNRGLPAIPSRPLPLGWVINSIAFAAGWWAIGALRQRRRRPAALAAPSDARNDAQLRRAA